MSRRYRRIMRRSRLSMLLAVIATGSMGAAVGSVLTSATGSIGDVVTAGVIACSGGHLLGLIVRPTIADVLDAIGDDQ